MNTNIHVYIFFLNQSIIIFDCDVLSSVFVIFIRNSKPFLNEQRDLKRYYDKNKFTTFKPSKRDVGCPHGTVCFLNSVLSWKKKIDRHGTYDGWTRKTSKYFKILYQQVHKWYFDGVLDCTIWPNGECGIHVWLLGKPRTMA